MLELAISRGKITIPKIIWSVKKKVPRGYGKVQTRIPWISQAEVALEKGKEKKESQVKEGEGDQSAQGKSYPYRIKQRCNH